MLVCASIQLEGKELTGNMVLRGLCGLTQAAPPPNCRSQTQNRTAFRHPPSLPPPLKLLSLLLSNVFLRFNLKGALSGPTCPAAQLPSSQPRIPHPSPGSPKPPTPRGPLPPATTPPGLGWGSPSVGCCFRCLPFLPARPSCAPALSIYALPLTPSTYR